MQKNSIMNGNVKPTMLTGTGRITNGGRLWQVNAFATFFSVGKYLQPYNRNG